MLWRDPLAFAALGLVPALVLFVVWAEGRRRRALETFVAAGLQAVVVPDVDPRRRRLRHGLVTAAVALLVVALAGPRWGFEWEEVKREGIDIVIALDTSRSMLATDVKPDRLSRAKLGVRDLTEAARSDRLALVAFAGTAFLQCPLTLDHAAFLQSLDAIQVGIIPRGGTNLQQAIATGLEAFDGREGRHQALVLITDGEKTEGDVAAAIEAAKGRGVHVFTVGIGTTEGELVPVEGGGWAKDRKGQVVKSRLDEATLEKVAVETGGVYLHAQGPTLGLTDLYRDHLATLDRRPLGSTLERRFEHRYQWPLAAALALLRLEPLVGERRVPPAGRSWRRWRRAAAAVVLAALSVGWLDPDAPGRAGNQLYAAGKFEEAAKQYNQALIDQPDSAPLHYNLGVASYKAGRLDDAEAALRQVPAADAEPKRTAAAAYGLGNVAFRQGEAAEAKEPQKALQLWGEALAAYRRALGIVPDDEDAKFNHELVQRRIEALRKKLEEQQQQQQQQQQQEQKDDGQKDRQQAEKPDQQQAQEQQQGEQPQGDQQQGEPQEQQEGEQRQADRQPDSKPPDTGSPQGDEHRPPTPDHPEQQAGDAQAGSPPPGEQQAAQAAAGGEAREGEMSRQEAAALLDAQRQQEMQPGEVIRRLQGRVVAPAEDW